jgi:hypothetical protein
MTLDRPTRCVRCGEPLPVPALTGRVRLYCSEKCRYAARRHRASRSIPAALSVPPVEPAALRRRRLAAALAQAMEGAPPAAPEDRLAAVLLELLTAIAELDRLGPDLAPALSVRAEELRRRIEDALTRGFKEVIHA